MHPQAESEVRVLMTLQHPNVVTYHKHFTDSGMLNIVLEYADNGDLAQHIARAKKRGLRFKEDLVLYWFAQIACALHYVHSQNILHRDLKTQNIFLTKENIIKLGDFGIAKVLHSTGDMARTVIGTPYYMSPELCEDLPYNHKVCAVHSLSQGQSSPALLCGSPCPVVATPHVLPSPERRVGARVCAVRANDAEPCFRRSQHVRTGSEDPARHLPARPCRVQVRTHAHHIRRPCTSTRRPDSFPCARTLCPCWWIYACVV